MSRLYEREALATALRDARERSLALYADMDLDGVSVPFLPTVNPPNWELAHLAWFQEFWCLRNGDDPDPARWGRPRFPEADAFFNSSLVPHERRWRLPYPKGSAILGYLGVTLEDTLAALERVPDDRLYFFHLALYHEDMHAEAFAMTLQTLDRPLGSITCGEAPPSEREAPRDVTFAGGTFVQGSARGARRFAFDNEEDAHPVVVAPFRMSSHLVTQGEFARFTDEGGYIRDVLWDPAGWDWRRRERREQPKAWRGQRGSWHVRRFGRDAALDPHAPMVHVNLHEARAFCRWAGRRLPTESEWEFAAKDAAHKLADPIPALDLHHDAPSHALPDAAPHPEGLRHLLGAVWEWTSSPFSPYPRFVAGPYRDYSVPWFGNHYVLRGGSFATRSRLVSTRYRNFYLPARDDVFAGFRTCALGRA